MYKQFLGTFIKTERSKGPKGPCERRFLPKFRLITQSTHRTSNDPPKSGFIYKNLFSLQISAHLAFKWPRKKNTFWGVIATSVGALGNGSKFG